MHACSEVCCSCPVCVYGESCQLPPCGEHGNMYDLACGAVQNIRVVPDLDLVSLGDIIAQGNVQSVELTRVAAGSAYGP